MITKKSRPLHKFALKSSSCALTDLRSGGNCRGAKSIAVNEIAPEMAELLELLNSREQFDEVSKLFEHSLRPWEQYSEDERKWLIDKAASIMSNGAP